MKIKILTLTLCFYIPLHAAENSDAPKYYPEFLATLQIASRLHELVNETDIDVKSATSVKEVEGKDGIKKKSLFLECQPDWNTTDKGLIAYFEEGHLTKVYTPFGSWLIFWLTRTDKKWNPVLKKFEESCGLDKKPFKDKNAITYKDAFTVLAFDNQSLPKPTQILQGDRDRKTMLSACIAKYLQDGGTLTKLESLGERKKRLAEQRKAHPPLTILDLLFRPFDLSN